MSLRKMQYIHDLAKWCDIGCSQIHSEERCVERSPIYPISQGCLGRASRDSLPLTVQKSLGQYGSRQVIFEKGVQEGFSTSESCPHCAVKVATGWTPGTLEHQGGTTRKSYNTKVKSLVSTRNSSLAFFFNLKPWSYRFILMGHDTNPLYYREASGI